MTLLSLGCGLGCGLGSHAAFAAQADLFLVLQDDGRSYTLHQTVIVDNEALVVELPEGITPDFVQVQHREPPASGELPPPGTQRLELNSGMLSVRYRHHFESIQHDDPLDGTRITMSSLPGITLPIGDTVHQQSLTWIFPPDISIEHYAIDIDTAQWSLDNNVLKLQLSSNRAGTIRIHYRRPDSDGDGVPDARGPADLCADTPTGFPVDTNGCALDSDGDHVLDGQDLCPSTPAGEPVNTDGCALDFDQDGVPNYLDQCRDSPTGIKVDSRGCTADTDRDGVSDARDECSETPANVPVESNGCAPDEDNDRVPDYRDLCVNSTPPTNQLGCADTSKPLVIEGVSFNTGSSFLSVDTRRALNPVAAAILHLSDLQFEIGAHTDDQGTRKNNQALSSRRASSVRRYLMLKGISANRITARGYGESRPLVPNRTLEARQTNRRIELRVLD